jgi:hypothetical protein
MRKLVALGVAALALSMATPAWAGDEALADSLFQEGQAAMGRQDYKAACDAFAASHKADPAPGTLVNLGICNEKQGKIASAWSAFNGARELAVQKGQTERASAAKGEADRLLPNVQKVQFALNGTYDGLVVKRDGETVPNEALRFPVAIDPGKHHLDVSANGKKARAIDFEITPIASGGKALESVEVGTLEDAPRETTQGASFDHTAAPDATEGSSRRTTGLIVAGAGLLVAAASIGFFVVGGSEDDKKGGFSPRPDGTCTESFDPNQCTSGFGSHDDAAKGDRLLGIVTLGTGLVAVGVGAYLFFTAPKAQKTGRPTVVPTFAPAYAGASLGMAF